jgi:membrane associated rhomboid family serine protease
MTKQLKRATRSVRSQVELLLFILALMWILELIDTILGGSLNGFGIRPREVDGLSGILFAPMLHGSFAHLATNSIPFAVLGWFVLARRRDEFWLVTAAVWIASGLGAWLFGASNSIHIGASGVVFGYFGFLLFRGVFDRSWVSLVLAVVVIAIYGPIIFGLLPLQVGISWQGHLFGFLGGAFVAWLVARR